jgi:pimeloyl-ACP methyl ester carboxylesterase
MTMLRLSDGASLAYTVTGNGPPLLLIAGTGYPGSTWWPESLERLGRSHSVIDYDHRGTGDSTSSADPYTTRLLTADAAELLRESGMRPAHVVGHSMGGRVAQWLAIDAPDLVASLILVATGSGRLQMVPPQTRGVPIATILRLVDLGYDEMLRDQIRRTFFTPEFEASHPERVAWLFDAFWRRRPVLQDYLKHVEARQTHDAHDSLGSIRLPTLLVVGSHDTHAGATGPHLLQSQALVELIPDARLEIVEGGSHGLFWQLPEQMDAIILAWCEAHRDR